MKMFLQKAIVKQKPGPGYGLFPSSELLVRGSRPERYRLLLMCLVVHRTWGSDPIAEDNTHSGHRIWKTQAGAALDTSSWSASQCCRRLGRLPGEKVAAILPNRESSELQ